MCVQMYIFELEILQSRKGRRKFLYNCNAN